MTSRLESRPSHQDVNELLARTEGTMERLEFSLRRAEYSIKLANDFTKESAMSGALIFSKSILTGWSIGQTFISAYETLKNFWNSRLVTHASTSTRETNALIPPRDSLQSTASSVIENGPIGPWVPIQPQGRSLSMTVQPAISRAETLILRCGQGDPEGRMAGNRSEDHDPNGYSGVGGSNSHWDEALRYYSQAAQHERQALNQYGHGNYGDLMYTMLDAAVARGLSVKEAILSVIDYYRNAEPYNGSYYFPQQSDTEILRSYIDKINETLNGINN